MDDYSVKVVEAPFYTTREIIIHTVKGNGCRQHPEHVFYI